MSTEAGAVRPDVALTFLCPLQTDCALWTVQLQRQLPGQEVGRDLSAELTAVEGDAALRLCGERGRRLRAFLHLDPGCPRVRPPPRTLAARGYEPPPWLSAFPEIGCPGPRGCSRALPVPPDAVLQAGVGECGGGGGARAARRGCSSPVPSMPFKTRPLTRHGHVWPPDVFLLDCTAICQNLNKLPTL